MKAIVLCGGEDAEAASFLLFNTETLDACRESFGSRQGD